ncbi:MAG: DUF4384 domain-containing protein [Pyrinomonadaceae bacterium]
MRISFKAVRAAMLRTLKKEGVSMMHSRVILSFALILMLCGLGVSWAQDQGSEEVRGAFLSSREKTGSTKPRNRTPRRPSPAKKTNTNSSTNLNTGKTNANNDSDGGTTSPGPAAIGLGYTLFMRDTNGDAVRVDPSEEFHTGERVRITLEPNVDGYLYIFHSEGDGPPQMIFPDWRLQDGDNAIEAHVPYEVPASFEKDERLRWFTFDSNPSTEHLHIVVTREPLADVPTGDALKTFCATNKTKCPWKPAPEMWAKVQEAAKADVEVVASTNYGQPQTDKEKVATTRGLGLDQTAPAPSVIRMSASTKAPVLVTVLDLIHK